MSDTPSNPADWLTRFSLHRRITVLVLFLTILVVGFIAALGIPLELFPRGFEAKSLSVFIPWQNAPSQEVLEKITLPLEEELSTVRGLAGINTFTSIGRVNAHIRFKQGANMDVAYREVRDRVERARLQFPDDVDRTYVFKHDASGIPVAVIGLAIDPALTDYYHLIQQEVLRPLSRVEGVAKVDVDGLEEKEIIIEVDRNRAEANGLNLYELAEDLGSDNFTLASGNVRDAGRKFLLRSVATYASLEQIENRPITPHIRLKDIARIRYVEPEKRYSVRVNSRPAVAAIVFKEGEANTVEVSRNIDRALDAMRENPRLVSIHMESLFNQGKVVRESMSSLVAGGRIGGLFAALILFLFLRRFRLTAIITLSIPLSILISLLVMFFLGETLNILTILGLVICVGLLVDNSVVVAENIHRHHKDGLPRREACIRGAGEIALAITMATLTTVIVFLPAALVEGEGQFFLLRLALPISMSLIASLFVALIFIPLSVYLTLPTSQTPRPTPWRRGHEALNNLLRRLYELTFERANHFYNHLLAFFLRHRLDLVLLLAAAFALTQIFAFKHIEIVETQEEDETSFRIGVSASNEHGLEDIAEFFAAIEKVLEQKKDDYALRGYFLLQHPRGGRIEGWFEDDHPNKRPAKEIAEKLLKDFPQKPGFKLSYGREDQNEEAKGRDVHVVRLEGEDAGILESVRRELEPVFTRVPGVLGVRLEDEEPPAEMALVINRQRASEAGVNPAVIAGMIGYALRGSSLPKHNQDGREIPVRIRFQESDREHLDDLGAFLVPTATGDTLSIASLTQARMLNTPRGIFRRDKKITQNLTIELKEEGATETRERLMALQRQIDLPEGVTFGSLMSETRSQEIANLQFAALLSILFIYLLMGFLFESFILPLSIIFTIPLASIGVIWIHYLTGKDLDFLGLVGSILLIGVVVNNGIVLIDYVNRLRREGLNRADALLKAADRRFRPIAMTALTTIFGMIPLALSKPSDIGLSYKSFGLTLIGGMTTATLLTLLVVPVFYTFFDDARNVLGGALNRLLHPPPQPVIHDQAAASQAGTGPSTS